MFHSTTILAVRHRGQSVLAGDGQVTFGQTVMKQSARKIRRLYNDRILAGFAGSAADSFALFARFESKLEQYRGNLERSVVEPNDIACTVPNAVDLFVIKVRGSGSIRAFLSDDRALRGIRNFNLTHMNRGRNAYQASHCYSLADHMLDG